MVFAMNSNRLKRATGPLLACLAAWSQSQPSVTAIRPASHPMQWYQLETWTGLPVIKGPHHQTPCAVQMGLRGDGTAFVAFPDGWIEAVPSGGGFLPIRYERVPMPPAMAGFARAGSVIPADAGGAYWSGPAGHFRYQAGVWTKLAPLDEEWEWAARVGKVIPLPDGTALAISTTRSLLVRMDLETHQERDRIPYGEGTRAGDLAVQEPVCLVLPDKVLIYMTHAGCVLAYDLRGKGLEEWSVPWSVFAGEKGSPMQPGQAQGGRHLAAFTTAPLWIPTSPGSALLVGLIATYALAPAPDRLMQAAEVDFEEKSLKRLPMPFTDRKDPFWWKGPDGTWLPLAEWASPSEAPVSAVPLTEKSSRPR